MDSEYTISESNVISNNYEDSDYNDEYDLPRHKKKISRRKQLESSTSVNKPIEEYQFNEIFPGVNINAAIKINRINPTKKSIHQTISDDNSPYKSNSVNSETNNYSNIPVNTTEYDTNENIIDNKNAISTVVLPSSSNDLKLKKRITPTLITTSNYNKLSQENSVQHLQNNQVDIRKKKKDIYDFNPIVDSETENRLKLLPKPIYKYIPKSPISVDSVEEKDKNNEDDKNKQNNKPNNNNENDINTEDFIQFVEPSEEELANRIEYDMDEQDMVWLKKVNKLRIKNGLEVIEPLFFEHVMDRLEKEWFDLNKNLPAEKSDNQSSEDSVCEICNNGECENSNAIVFCDGCNIAVHQDCYGVPFIPEGQWLCRKCMISPEAQVSCVLCPNKGGAFKQTDFNCWAHLSCALWIPECSQANIVYMEPIINIEKIPRSRWSLLCYLCKKPMGACIQCSKKLCCTAFHVTCAKEAGLFMELVKNGGMDKLECKAYCDKHTPESYKHTHKVSETVKKYRLKCAKELRAIKKARRRNLLTGEYDKKDLYIAEELFNGKEDDYDITKAKGDFIVSFNSPDINNETSSSTVNESTTDNEYINSIPYESFFSGKWVIPKSIAEKIIHSLCEENDEQQKRQFIIDVAKYWSLKRESRGGASLLKRLHIEPWSAFSTSYIENGSKKLKTLEVLATIRNNLEKMRTMTKMIEERERRKLLITKIQKRIIEIIHFPISAMVRPIFNDIKKNDREEYFWYPVNQQEVEDYYDIIKHPMSFDIIENRINTHQYKSVEAFKNDMDQIWANAMLYNKEDTHYYITAVKLKNRINRIIKPVYEEEERLFSNQAIKALKVKLPSNFWHIEFSLNEPIERFDLIDVNCIETKINKTSDEKDNHSSSEPLPLVKESDNVSLDEGKIVNESHNNKSDGKNPSGILLSSNQERKGKLFNNEIKEKNLSTDTSIEKNIVLDGDTTVNLNNNNEINIHKNSSLGNEDGSNKSTSSKLETTSLDENEDKKASTPKPKLQSLSLNADEKNKLVTTPKMQRISSENHNSRLVTPKLQRIIPESNNIITGNRIQKSNDEISLKLSPTSMKSSKKETSTIKDTEKKESKEDILNSSQKAVKTNKKEISPKRDMEKSEDNDKNINSSPAAVKTSKKETSPIKGIEKNENMILKENSLKIKNVFSKISNNSLSIKKNDIISSNNKTKNNKKLKVNKTNKTSNQEENQHGRKGDLNHEESDIGDDDTINNSFIDIEGIESNDDLPDIDRLKDENINKEDLKNNEKENETKIGDIKKYSTIENNLPSKDSTLIDLNIALEQKNVSLNEDTKFKNNELKNKSDMKLTNPEIVKVKNNTEQENNHKNNESIKISKKNDTIKTELTSNENDISDSPEKKNEKVHDDKKSKVKNKKDDLSETKLREKVVSTNPNTETPVNNEITKVPTGIKDNSNATKQIKENKETLPVLRKSKRSKKKKNEESDTLDGQKINGDNSNSSVKRKFEDRDLVQGYLDENNQYHETEELKARYKELERELKESELLDNTSDISVNLPDENESLGSLSVSDGDEHFLNIYSLTKNDDLDNEFASLFQNIKKDAYQTIKSFNKETQQTVERKTRSKTRSGKNLEDKNLADKEITETDVNTPMTSSSSYEIIDIDGVDDNDQEMLREANQQSQKKKEREESDFEKFLKVYSRNKNLALRINMKEHEEEGTKAKTVQKKGSINTAKVNNNNGDLGEKVIHKEKRKRGRPPLQSDPAKKLRSSSRIKNTENTSNNVSNENKNENENNNNNIVQMETSVNDNNVTPTNNSITENSRKSNGETEIPLERKNEKELSPRNSDETEITKNKDKMEMASKNNDETKLKPMNKEKMDIPPNEKDEKEMSFKTNDTVEIPPKNNDGKEMSKEKDQTKIPLKSNDKKEISKEKDEAKKPPKNNDEKEISKEKDEAKKPPKNNDEKEISKEKDEAKILPKNNDESEISFNNNEEMGIPQMSNEETEKSSLNNNNKRKNNNNDDGDLDTNVSNNNNDNNNNSNDNSNSNSNSNTVKKSKGRKKKIKSEEINKNSDEKNNSVNESSIIDDNKRVTRSSTRNSSNNSSTSNSRNSSRSNSRNSSKSNSRSSSKTNSQINSPVIDKSNKSQALPTIVENDKDNTTKEQEQSREMYSLRSRHSVKKEDDNDNKSQTELSQNTRSKRKVEEVDKGNDKENPSKRVHSTKTKSDTITSPPPSASSASNHRIRHKKFVMSLMTAPSSSTKTKEIVINENVLLMRKDNAISKFKTSVDESNKITKMSKLEDDKDWMSFLKYECGADIVTNLIKNKKHKVRGWYWKRVK